MDTVNQINLIDIYQTLHPKTGQNIRSFQVLREHIPGQAIFWDIK